MCVCIEVRDCACVYVCVRVCSLYVLPRGGLMTLERVTFEEVIHPGETEHKPGLCGGRHPTVKLSSL